MTQTKIGPSLIERLQRGETSPIKKYQEMFVGNPSLLSLIKYELLISCLTPFPGALGYFLRKTLFKSMFKRVGTSVFFGKHLTIRCPQRISFGNHVSVDDNVVLDAKGTSSIELGNKILIGRNSILSCTDALIQFGDHLSIGPNCYFTSKSKIIVGSDVSIGPNTYLIAGSHTFEAPDIPVIQQERISEGIHVKEGVWLGAGVIIQDGVTIGKHSIVGSGAVVTKNIPEYSIAVGVPAKVVKKRR